MPTHQTETLGNGGGPCFCLCSFFSDIWALFTSLLTWIASAFTEHHNQKVLLGLFLLFCVLCVLLFILVIIYLAVRYGCCGSNDDEEDDEEALLKDPGKDGLELSSIYLE